MDVCDKFYVHGEIRSIRMVKKQCCAFVTFVKREEAEIAASKLHRLLEIKGKKANLMWGRPQQTAQTQASAAIAAGATDAAAAPPGGMPGMPPMMGGQGTYKPYYPSMDPEAMGNTRLEGEGPNAAPSAPAPKAAFAAPAPAAPAPAPAPPVAVAGRSAGSQ